MAELFTDEWAAEVAAALKAGPTDEYKARVLPVYWAWIDMARADFDGQLAFGIRGLPATDAERFLVVSVERGNVTGAVLAETDAGARYTLVGTFDDWADLVQGYEAGKAVMYRRFKLEDGDLLDFFRRIYVWVEMLALIGRVPADVPTLAAASG